MNINSTSKNSLNHAINGRSLQYVPKNMSTIILGMGCFWGAEKLFWNLKSIFTTSVGYAGGFFRDPSYKDVCTGKTGHSEVVKLVFDDDKIELLEILKVFWENHDPTQGNRQGNDIGSQYRSTIYCEKNSDLNLALSTKDIFQKNLNNSGYGLITTEIKLLDDFFLAEEYHQQYLYKNPNGYCGIKGCNVRFKNLN